MAIGARLRRVAAGVCLVLLSSLLATAGAPIPALADELYEVLGVKVDETAETAAAARERALATGERRAWDELVERLVDPQQRRPLPEFSARDIGDAVKDFWVTEEKTSTVRYIATLNYNFRPDRVRRLLSGRGIRFTAARSEPVVVVPLYERDGERRLWDSPNPWRDAWQATPSPRMLPLRVPVGDLADLAALSAEQVASGDKTRLAEFGQRHGGGSALVAVARVGPGAEPDGRQLQVTATNWTAAGGRTVSERVYPLQSDEPTPDVWRQAAATVAQDVEGAWRRGTSVAPKPRVATTTATVVVPIRSLEEWTDLRQRLEGVPQMQRVTLVSATREAVRVAVVYPGTVDQLTAALAERNLGLRNEDGTWRLSPSAPAVPTPPPSRDPAPGGPLEP